METISLAGVSIGEVAVLIAAIGGASAALVAVREYRLKSQAQRVEIDVQLSKLLAELVPIANGRGGCVVSEAAAEVIANANVTSPPDQLAEALEAATIGIPVGEATQAAAVTSLGYLGAEHDALCDAPSRHWNHSSSCPIARISSERDRTRWQLSP